MLNERAAKLINSLGKVWVKQAPPDPSGVNVPGKERCRNIMNKMGRIASNAPEWGKNVRKRIFSRCPGQSVAYSPAEWKAVVMRLGFIALWMQSLFHKELTGQQQATHCLVRRWHDFFMRYGIKHLGDDDLRKYLTTGLGVKLLLTQWSRLLFYNCICFNPLTQQHFAKEYNY